MAYVEQFDSLPQRSTAREAIAFSAALRLSSNITEADRNAWVDSVLNMLDLIPLENELVSMTDVPVET
jgi:ABC-type multidrug transport system ATPase subunit